jgi:hypothetical protein
VPYDARLWHQLDRDVLLLWADRNSLHSVVVEKESGPASREEVRAIVRRLLQFPGLRNRAARSAETLIRAISLRSRNHKFKPPAIVRHGRKAIVRGEDQRSSNRLARYSIHYRATKYIGVVPTTGVALRKRRRKASAENNPNAQGERHGQTHVSRPSASRPNLSRTVRHAGCFSGADYDMFWTYLELNLQIRRAQPFRLNCARAR